MLKTGMKALNLNGHFWALMCQNLLTHIDRFVQIFTTCQKLRKNQTHCVCCRHGGNSVELAFGDWWLSAQHGFPEGGLTVWHWYAVPPGSLGEEVQTGNLFCQGVPVEKQSLSKTSAILSGLGYRLVGWLHIPVFWMNDGVDKRVVDSRCLCYYSRNSFGIGIEDASISEKGKRFVRVELYITCDDIDTLIWLYCVAEEVEYGSWLMAEMNYRVQASILHCVCFMFYSRVSQAANAVRYDYEEPVSYCIFTQPRRWEWRMHRATRKAQTLWWPQRQSWPASIQSWWTAAGSGSTSSPETPISPNLCLDRGKEQRTFLEHISV